MNHARPTSVVMVIADGLGTGALSRAIARGDVPAIAQLRDEGAGYTITTVFPSVTGVAYIPMLTGCHPATVGVPGLRWFDRARTIPAWLGHSRSYVGLQVRQLDRDLSPGTPTAWEIAGGSSLGMFAMLTRGLPRSAQIDRGWSVAARGIRAHLTGDVSRWLALEEDLAGDFVRRVRRERPRFAFASLAGGDKAAHAEGTDGPLARQALRLVDDVVRRLRADAERDGRWPGMHLWVVSDHGHSPVEHHYDLAVALRESGLMVRAHPWTVPDRSDAAVMVSGNSMAHVYFNLTERTRTAWPPARSRDAGIRARLLSHPAVDLVAHLAAPGRVEVTRRGIGTAEIEVRHARFSYRQLDGDPLGLEFQKDICGKEAHERTASSGYPDGLVQLAALVSADRSGDLIVSASPGWDLRARYEPIRHRSSHGALHRAHMEVPLVVSRRFPETPRRTIDLYPVLRSLLGSPQVAPRGTGERTVESVAGSV